MTIGVLFLSIGKPLQMGNILSERVGDTIFVLMCICIVYHTRCTRCAVFVYVRCTRICNFGTCLMFVLK